MEIDDNNLDDVKDIAGSAAAVAVALASVTFSGSHGRIQPLIEDWVAAEHQLSLTNLKDINEGLTEAEEAERDRLEHEFTGKLGEFLVKPQAVTGFKVEFPGEPRGPAVRVMWDNCPSNSLGGGLVIPLF